MEGVLALIAIFILLLDLQEHRACHRPNSELMPQRRQSTISREVHSADAELNRLTDDAVLAMLDEVRHWTPGGRE